MTVEAPRRPTGPPGRIGFGNQRDYETDRIGFLLRNQREYGDVFAFSDDSTVILDPELIQRIHQRTNAEFVTEMSMFSDKRRAQWLLTTIDATMVNRRSGWRGVKRSASLPRADRLVSVCDRTVDATDGAEVDVVELTRRIAGLSAAEFCLGGAGDDVSALVDALDPAVQATMDMMNRPWRPPSWLPLPRTKRFERTARRFGAELDNLMERRHGAATPDEPRDLLDVMAGDDLADVPLMLTLMLRASYANPGAALAFAVRQFAHRPDVVARLRAESAELGDPMSSDRRYAEAVVKEILRMYPPSWLGGREVVEPVTVGEWDFRPGDQVMFSPYVVHRDERFWSDPEKFDPDRWLTGKSPHTRHAYLPFGAGPRICVGNQLAMVELTLDVARLAERYDIEVSNPDVPAIPQTVLAPQGLRARFVRRDG